MQQLYNSRRMTEVLIPSSGKMVLIDKLLPKLKKEGHKVGGGGGGGGRDVDVSIVVELVNPIFTPCMCVVWFLFSVSCAFHRWRLCLYMFVCECVCVFADGMVWYGTLTRSLARL